MVEAYRVIGDHMGEPERWRFPVPVNYPYPGQLPDGSWLPLDDLAEWSQHFVGSLEPAFGSALTMNADHIGVLIHPTRGPGFDVLHSHRTSGVVLHPFDRVARWATGFYKLRTTDPVCQTSFTNAP